MAKLSYRAILHARKGTLLGGQTTILSSRFETRDDARDWLEQTIIVNRELGKFPGKRAIVAVDLPFEIATSIKLKKRRKNKSGGESNNQNRKHKGEKHNV